MHPDQPRLWLARGRRYAELKRWTEADADLAKVVDLKRDDPQIWAERGRFYAEHRQFHKAAADFNKALDLLGDGENFGNPWFVDRAGVDDELARWDDVFAQVAEQRPNDWHVWAARFRRFTSRGQWKLAVDVLDKIKELAPHRYESWYFEAPLRLEIGDVEGYRRACRDMLEKYGQTDNPTLALHIARTCLLAPDAAPDLKPVVQLAERAVTATENNPAYRDFLLIRALADYRSGDYARAVDRIASLAPNPTDWATDAGAYLVAAQANQRLGRADAAKQELAQAEAIMDRFPKIERGQQLGDNWYACLSCQIAHREAKALIDDKQKPD
jgi:Flp pilus assembly protein TadD